MPAYANAASKTRRVRRFFTGADDDVVSELSAVARALGECRAGKRSKE
jgi:hypothetical protein